MCETSTLRMNGNKQEQAVDTEQNAVELVTAKPWSLWKTFLVCLLACLIATALVVLVLYFVHFGKPTTGTTIVIQADGKFSHVICIPGSTPSPASSLLPGSQGTPPSILVPNQSSSTTVPPSTPVANQSSPTTVPPSTPVANQSSPNTVPPSTPVANQSSPTTVPPSTMVTTRTTTVEHEVIIEGEEDD